MFWGHRRPRLPPAIKVTLMLQRTLALRVDEQLPNCCRTIRSVNDNAKELNGQQILPKR